jgi:methionyl-tRNA formyltransferase
MHKVLFLGRKTVAAQALKWLKNRSDIEIVGVVTDSHLPVSATRDVAEQFNLPLYNRNSLEELSATGKLEFDLAVSMLYWQKIRPPILTSARKGVINFHPAPLPDYKGTGGYNVAILKNLPEWGVSAHYVDEEIDTGPIIRVDKFVIDQINETAHSLERRCRQPLLELFKSVVEQALRSPVTLPAAPNFGGVYISRDEMESMKEIKDGDDIPRKIRAFWFPPYDGAYLLLGGKKYTLVDRSILTSLADPEVGNLFMSGNQADSL